MTRVDEVIYGARRLVKRGGRKAARMVRGAVGEPPPGMPGQP
jgi:hypothetical protein